MSVKRLLLLLGVLLLGSCGDGSDRGSGEALTSTSLAGVYAGTFPCDGCPGIDTTLWLRPDKRFFLKQHYPADDQREATDAYSFGRWADDDGEVHLRGRGPVRTFSRLDADTLVMQTHSDLEHRVTREPAAPDFDASIRMSGTMRLRADGASFTECLTGYDVPVTRGRELSRFRHQYRSAATRGQVVYVELTGRFAWSASGGPEALTIERFITVKPDGSC